MTERNGTNGGHDQTTGFHPFNAASDEPFAVGAKSTEKAKGPSGGPEPSPRSIGRREPVDR
jgi:hypothetical protein